jgi:hypothetical protein
MRWYFSAPPELCLQEDLSEAAGKEERSSVATATKMACVGQWSTDECFPKTCDDFQMMFPIFDLHIKLSDR